jgi:hypothetical protein
MWCSSDFGLPRCGHLKLSKSTTAMTSIDKVETKGSETSDSFRQSLAQFTFSSESLTPSSLRRSLRNFKSTGKTTTKEEEEEKLPTLALESGTPRKKRTLDAKNTPNPSRSPSKKAKRGYAAPAVYAHLNVLQDYLKEELDGTGLPPKNWPNSSCSKFSFLGFIVVFCGIKSGSLLIAVAIHARR